MLTITNPTGKPIRGYDKWGSGAFRAPRGNHTHRGVDFICAPGQDILCPIDGTIVREARPYAKGKYSGVLIRNHAMDIKMFYFRPDPHLITAIVNKGKVIGKAQDISDKYEGITPHIHLEISAIDPRELLKEQPGSATGVCP